MYKKCTICGENYEGIEDLGFAASPAMCDDCYDAATTDRHAAERMETPAYLRREKVLFQAPASDNNQVSRMTISENTEEVDHIVKPNRHLHDNVD